MAVRECLSMMSLAYKGVTGPSAVIVEALMLEHIASVRHLYGSCTHLLYM